jgi:hypothetical protein
MTAKTDTTPRIGRDIGRPLGGSTDHEGRPAGHRTAGRGVMAGRAALRSLAPPGGSPEAAPRRSAARRLTRRWTARTRRRSRPPAVRPAVEGGALRPLSRPAARRPPAIRLEVGLRSARGSSIVRPGSPIRAWSPPDPFANGISLGVRSTTRAAGRPARSRGPAPRTRTRGRAAAARGA